MVCNSLRLWYITLKVSEPCFMESLYLQQAHSIENICLFGFGKKFISCHMSLFIRLCNWLSKHIYKEILDMTQNSSGLFWWKDSPPISFHMSLFIRLCNWLSKHIYKEILDMTQNSSGLFWWNDSPPRSAANPKKASDYFIKDSNHLKHVNPDSLIQHFFMANPFWAW